MIAIRVSMSSKEPAARLIPRGETTDQTAGNSFWRSLHDKNNIYTVSSRQKVLKTTEVEYKFIIFRATDLIKRLISTNVTELLCLPMTVIRQSTTINELFNSERVPQERWYYKGSLIKKFPQNVWLFSTI